MWCRRAGDRGALMRGCPGRLKKSGTFFLGKMFLFEQAQTGRRPANGYIL